MLDSETLRPVIIAMTLYLIAANMLPKILKEPSGIQFLDDINMMLIAQRGSLMSGTILTGALVFMTNYINEEML